MGRSGNVFSAFTENPLRDFFVLKVPKGHSQWNNTFEDLPEPIENAFENLQFGRDFIEEFETELITFKTDETIKKEVCHHEHCCNFKINIQPLALNSTFQYRFVAFNGHRTYSGWGEKKLVICAIIICNDETLNSCGRVPNCGLDQITFNHIVIRTTFNRFGVLMMPNSLDMKMNPLSVDEFSYDEAVTSELSRTSTISLLKPHSDLQTFALYGHDFEVDEEFDLEEKSRENDEQEDNDID